MTLGCLDENTLTALAQGCLVGESFQRAEQHLDGCNDCRWLLAEVAAPEGHQPTLLQPGDKVGRYVVIEHIGSGGMGVVYATYDPQLDRRVALKLLQKRWLAADQAERLQRSLRREAQAMARLSHPNVLPIHDIGLFGDQLYLVMELVRGGSLRQWLKAAPRRWQDIVAAFLAAGQGLRAAHHAGILHCDFKPDNVLCSEDGRIQVTDFGLSRLAATADLLDSDSVASGEGTPGSALGGTPAYMAPEQFLGETLSPKTDQFSFCVALYEALYGSRPFSGHTAAQLQRAVLTDPVRPPPPLPAPVAVRRVLLRGLARQPEARFANLDELLRHLGRDPGQRWGRIALAVVVLGLALGLGGLTARSLRRPLARCQLDAAQADAVAATAQRVLQQQAAAQPALAQRLAARLAAYRQSWQAAMLQACTATRVRHEQSETTYQLRARCLAERLAELQTLTELLAELPRVPLGRLDAAALGLRSIGRCDVLPVLASRGEPPPPALAGRVMALRAQLARGWVLLHAGAYDRCASLAQQILSPARSLGYRPVFAEALLLQGSLELATHTPAHGEPTLKEALWFAQAARHDQVAAQAWVALLAAIEDQKERRAEAQKWSEHARAAVERLGGDAELGETLTALRAKLLPSDSTALTGGEQSPAP